MCFSHRAGAALLAALLAFAPASALAGDAAPHLATIKAVGKEGNGNPAAAKAVKELVRQGPSALLEILPALADAHPLAANYLRSAFESITDNALKQAKPLP